jgi:hypothetical protein
MAFRPLKMLKNLLLILLLVWTAKKLGRLSTAPLRAITKPFKSVPWKKIFDAGKKGIGKAFEKIKDFGKKLFGKKDEQTPTSFSDNVPKPVLAEAMLNGEQSKNLQMEQPRLVYQVPKEIRGVTLQPDERSLLREGKPLLLSGMNGDNGEQFSAFVKMNTQKGKLDFYNQNPDNPYQIPRFAEGQNHRQQHENNQKSANRLKIA